VLSPTIWVDILHHDTAIFPLKNPALVSLSAAFLVGIVVSVLQPEPAAAEKFESEKLRTYLGVGAE
jgi:cation/acetate symporter